MRLGLDAAKALPPWDGVANVSRHTLHALADLAREDAERGEAAGVALHEVLLYGVRGEDRERFRLQHPSLPAGFRLQGEGPPSRSEIDLFHSLTYRYPPTYDGPGVVTCYDLTVLTHPETHAVENKAPTVTGLLRALYAGAQFVAISQFTADELMRQLEVPAGRIDVVHLGIDPCFKPLATARARQQVSERFALDRPYILAVGTLEPRKNLQRLLAAYTDLPAAQRRETCLAVVGGGGWKHAQTNAYLQRHPELDGVRLLGRVTDEELVALYSAATVFAYPSLAEGFGLPVAEAMACGCPVVTSDTTSLPEVAGDAALLVDPTDVVALRDALTRLLADSAERCALSQAGLERAGRFSWQRSATELVAIYRRVSGGA